MFCENIEIVTKDGKCYKVVPPDGGWGYMIGTSLIILMVVITAPLGCFGLLFNDFFKAKKITTTEVTLINALANLSFSLFAFMTSIFLKQWTLKQVGLAGAVLFSIGNFGTIFMNSLFTMTITFVINGCGCGLMTTCIYTVFSMYFEKKRVFAMNICQTLISVISIAYPPLINLSMDVFGFRGTLALLFATGLHAILAFIVVQPVENHVILEEMNKKDLGQPEEIEPLTSIEKYTLSGKNFEELDNQKCKKQCERSKLERISDFLDLSLLQNLVFLNICIGMSIVSVSDTNFVALLPLHFYDEMWTENQVAFMMTVLLVGDTLARATLVVVSMFFDINSRILFLAGVSIMTVIRIILFSWQDVSTITGLVAVLGAMRCLIMVTYNLIISDAVPMAKNAAAQGLVMLITGVMCVVGGPITGALKDLTGSYLACFHVMTGMLLICVIPWTVELVMNWRRRQNKKSSPFE